MCSFSAPSPPTRLPLAAGIGLRAQHHAQVLAERPAVAWWEVHSENFFSAGGAPIEFLSNIRQTYPVSLHGVGLSLGAPIPCSKRIWRNWRRS